MALTKFKSCLLVAMLSFGIATISFADDAPVYEVDNFPPFDGQDAAMGSDSDSSMNSVQTAGAPQSTFYPESPEVAPSPPAQAYTPSVPKRPLNSADRLTRVEQQLDYLQQTNPASKTETLQKEIQVLRGQVEELTHQLQISQNQQRAMFADLDKRLSTMATQPMNKMDNTISSLPAKDKLLVNNIPSTTKVETKTIATTSKITVPNKTNSASNQPNAAEEQEIYQTAYDLIKSKKYSEAITTLKKMLQKYPTGQFAANAHYWLGELYSLLNQNSQSAAEFLKVVKQYPNSPKVSDAYLKLGLSYASQLKWSEAKDVFKQIIKTYPGTSTARLANDQLKQIKLAGH